MSCPLLVWKEEPESPLSINEGSLDATLYQTPLEEFGAKLEADLALSKFEVADVASPENENEYLADLEDIINLELKELIKSGKYLPIFIENIVIKCCPKYMDKIAKEKSFISSYTLE